MKRAIATAIRITGNCNAGYRIGDRILVDCDTACIDKEQSGNLCIFALSAILAGMGRIREGEKAMAACPDPATGRGGNVIFSVVKEG